MPSRKLIAKEMAEIFKILANPDRIRLVEELRGGEKDVNSISTVLGLPGPRVSQHLALLKAHRIVAERRDGRHHFYHLTRPDLAVWIIDGLDFIETRSDAVPKAKVNAARRAWTANQAAKAASR